jgi:hypothetical protein
MKVLVLDELPADPNAAKATEFLGVTDDEMWEACKEYARRMKGAKDPHAEFGLDREMIVQAADEIIKRNEEFIAERVDRKNPMALLGRLNKAPHDKPAWVLKLLRRHGFERVDLAVWVAADNFLSKWVEKKSMGLAGGLLKRLGIG